jgi:hypothetical protein
MKNTIGWHKDCLENQRGHYARLLEQIARLKEDYARGQQQINAYDAQIIRAEEMGVTEFDREKFNKKRHYAAEESRKETK